MATAFGTTYRFRAPGTPGRVARWTCLASAGVLLVTGVVAMVRAASDAEWRVQLFVPPEGSSAQPSLTALYPDAIGAVVWIGTLVFAATAVCWLVWQVRAHENLWAVPGVPAPTRKPGMAVIWWFIPFANLGMPYACVRELRTVSAARAGTTRRGGLLVAWWTLFVAAAAAGAVAVVWPWVAIVDQLVETGGELLGGTYVVDVSSVAWAVGVWHLLLAGAALAGSAVVADVERLQASMRPEPGVLPAGPAPAGSSGPGPAPPRPDLD